MDDQNHNLMPISAVQWVIVSPGVGEFVLPVESNLSVAIVPRAGENLTIRDGETTLVDGLVQNVRWVFEQQSQKLDITITLEAQKRIATLQASNQNGRVLENAPQPKQKGKMPLKKLQEVVGRIKSYDEFREWKRQMYTSIADLELTSRTRTLVLKYVSHYDGGQTLRTNLVFCSGEKLLSFDEWADALLAGEITYDMMRYCIRDIGIRGVDELLDALRRRPAKQEFSPDGYSIQEKYEWAVRFIEKCNHNTLAIPVQSFQAIFKSVVTVRHHTFEKDNPPQDHEIAPVFYENGSLLEFDEWKEAILTGRITPEHLLKLNRVGRKSIISLLDALRAIKDGEAYP